jgi:hypothetical protein
MPVRQALTPLWSSLVAVLCRSGQTKENATMEHGSIVSVRIIGFLSGGG